jgi:predicted nucleic acid-binding protein
VDFVDTNIFVYAHEGGAGRKHTQAVDLLTGLVEGGSGALSIQVLAEVYAVAIRKLRMTSREAAEAIAELASWTIHRPAHADLIRAAALHRRHKMSWWDALIVNSALELGCAILWSEDLTDGQRFGSMTVQNPFL